MLLLVDLDNTLVDRAAAFNAWSMDFVRFLGRPDSEAAWLIEADRDGYEPRGSLAHTIKERFRLDMAVENLVDRLLYEHVDVMTMDDGIGRALKSAKNLGWKIGVVTNGTTIQQTLKIQRVGLEPYVDDVIISEAVRVKKPDPRIFQIAAQRLTAELAGGWMVGDHPTADIAGGQAAGLATGWVSRGNEWPKEARSPTLIGASAAQVIDHVVRRSVLAN